MNVQTIVSDRLELVSMAPAFIDDVLAGRRAEAAAWLGAAIDPSWPTDHDLLWLRRRLEQMQADASQQEWFGRVLLLRDPEPVMVGHAGFHGPPGVNGPGKPQALEVGYTVFLPYQGRGFATEAARALMEWAQREHDIHDFIASVAPDNLASLAVVRKLGFAQTGEQWDEEDGLELVFECRARSSGA
ncbi:MAG: GNAT family N-acetyltransferase [Gaiellaceae bacterium]